MAAPRPHGYVDPTRPNPMGPGDASIIIYGYVPSLALAALAVALFTIATAAHAYQLFRYKTWYFTPIVVGCAMEVVGYIFRILSSKKDPYLVVYFVVQYFFIVVAPVFFSAAIYTVLTYLINAVGRQYSPIPPRVLLILFVVCDVIATIIQIAGAAMIGSAESKRKDPTTPNNILLAGLAFQVFTFFIFIILLSIFLWRARKVAVTTMMPFTLAFCAAVLLIYLRTCFRLAETAQGLMKTLSTHEVFFGCLEFAPVVIAILLFNLFHPGKWVPRYPRAGTGSA